MKNIKTEIDFRKFLINSLKSISTNSNQNDENKELTGKLSEENELKPMNSSVPETVSLEKYKLEVEQRVITKKENFSSRIFTFVEIFRRTSSTS